MAENTKIEWAHHTFNPWEGCQKVGPGCDHCYAESRNARFAGGQPINWGPRAPRRRTSEANWRQPLKWDAEAARLGIRYRVFCASLADVFDNEVPEEWRDDLFWLIYKTPHLDWLLLTKRIGNAATMMQDAIATVDPMAERRVPWPNVWIGATIVNQPEADRDIPKLLQVPAAKRFLSMEPLLGPVDLTGVWRHWNMSACEPGELPDVMIDWVIVGGESGPGARPMHPDWARSLRDQCQAAGVAFLFKQWGEWAPSVRSSVINEGIAMPGQNGAVWAFADGTRDGWRIGPIAVRIGKKAAGRLLDGRTWDEVPS